MSLPTLGGAWFRARTVLTVCSKLQEGLQAMRADTVEPIIQDAMRETFYRKARTREEAIQALKNDHPASTYRRTMLQTVEESMVNSIGRLARAALAANGEDAEILLTDDGVGWIFQQLRDELEPNEQE